VPSEVLDHLRAQAEGRKQRSDLDAAGESGDAASPVAMLAGLRQQMIEAEREELLRWRDAGRLPETELRALEHELDYEERLLAL
jgi:CPA1 family monovalent cation:H+ antiporter